MNLDLIKKAYLSYKHKDAQMMGEAFNNNWFSGTFTLKLINIFPDYKLSFIAKIYDENSNLIIDDKAELVEYDTNNIFNRNVLVELDDTFKEGILSKSFNEIEITIEKKLFVSHKLIWNQELMDEMEENLSISPISFRLNRYGKSKPWYLNYVQLPEESLILPENFSLSNDCINFFRSISLSNDPNWDCSIIEINYRGKTIEKFTKEIYIYQSDEQRSNDSPTCFLSDYIIIDSVNKLIPELINNNIWGPWRVFFKTYTNGTSEFFMDEGPRWKVVPLWFKNKIKEIRSKEIEVAYANNNKLFKTKSFTKEQLLQSIFDNISIKFEYTERLTCIEYNRNKDTGIIQPNYINSKFSLGWYNKDGNKGIKEIKGIYNESLLFLTVQNLIEQYYPEEAAYWTELEIHFDWKKLLAKNFVDNFSIEFKSRSLDPIKHNIFQAKGIEEYESSFGYSLEEYKAIEKKLEEEEAQEKLNQDQPITSDYLLQNIYGCISANVPDDFASIEAVITRSFDGDTQQLSGSYSYKPKGLFSSSKPVEPGEQIYPINVTIRLLDEFYTEQSKDWRKAVLTFKNDGTCNVKIGK
jgi:hypothetical protein